MLKRTINLIPNAGTNQRHIRKKLRWGCAGLFRNRSQLQFLQGMNGISAWEWTLARAFNRLAKLSNNGSLRRRKVSILSSSSVLYKMMKVRVECYAGRKGEERPLRF